MQVGKHNSGLYFLCEKAKVTKKGIEKCIKGEHISNIEVWICLKRIQAAFG